MALMKDARTFGIAWLGDRATIKHMPLLNMLALCGEEPPVVISIFDCSDHMSEGGERMQSTLGSCSRTKLLSLILLLHALMPFSLMAQAMFKKLGKFSVQDIQGHFISMVASMRCLYFSVILLVSDQSK